MKKAVVLLSGGLDSTVTAYIAKADMEELYTLTFWYGQRHSREIDSAVRISKELGAEWRGFQLELGQLVQSALTSDIEVPTEGVKTGIPVTWVPQRNSIFLALAFAYAETVGAEAVYAGMNSVDYSGYPDCRPEFISSIEKALNLGSKRFVETGKGISVVTPLMFLRKSDIVKVGSSLGVLFELTTSCYKGGEAACGLCDSCRIRLKAFEEVGLKDPIKYKYV